MTRVATHWSLAEYDARNEELPVYGANGDLLVLTSWESAVDMAKDCLADRGPLEDALRPFVGIFAHDGDPWHDADGNAWAEVPDIDTWGAGWVAPADADGVVLVAHQGDFQNAALWDDPAAEEARP